LKFDIRTFLFKFVHNPLITLSAGTLFVCATTRLSFSLVCALGLLAVDLLTVLFYRCARKYLPKEGRNFLIILISNFIGCIYFLLLNIFFPLLAAESVFLIIFLPIFCATSEVCIRCEELPVKNALSQTLREALCIGGLLIILSIIREPLGSASLTLPGGPEGMIELFNFSEKFQFSVRMLASSTGALFLLAYILVLFRVMDRRKYTRKDMPDDITNKKGANNDAEF
jgi:Na+-transporting NADH:ubiquinone oxidoreductase subunit NqrD